MEMDLMPYKSKHVKKIVFAIVESDWRAGFYLRIAKELPEYFEICGFVIKSEEKGIELERQYGIKTYRTIDSLLSEVTPSFMVVSVTRDKAPAIIKELVKRNIAVLAETPPAAGTDIDTLIELNNLVKQGAKIQVAEQHTLHPLHKARLELAHSGKIGQVNQVQLSAVNDHHAMSLIKRTLGLKFENAVIRAFEITTQVVAGAGRNGFPESEEIVNARQVVAYMQFGDKLAVYDFTNNQHRSWARSERFLIRGSKGEIKDFEVKYLKDFDTPVELKLRRVNAGKDGNLEGYYLKGILAGEEWIYKNQFMPGRLTDEEIAIADCISKMADYVNGGPDFYSLAEASQDVYLALMIEEAVKTKDTVVTKTQPWATE